MIILLFIELYQLILLTLFVMITEFNDSENQFFDKQLKIVEHRKLRNNKKSKNGKKQ